MGLADQPDTRARWMADVERQLRTLATAQRAANTSISDADGNELVRLDREGIKIYDATGVLRVRLGYIDPSRGYGISVWDEDADLRAEVNDDGWRDPWLAHPWRPQTSPPRESTTSATFVTLWLARVELLTHKGAAMTAAWVTDAGTTGEIRLKASTGQTSAVAIAAASAGTQQFQWLHGLALGGGPINFELQARRTGGAGSVHLDQPFGGLEMADPLQCDADGVP